MADLTVTKAKPNPRGKDRTLHFIPQDKLHGEWVDIQNTSGRNLNLAGVKVSSHSFTATCGDLGEKTYTTFGSIALAAGRTVRIHAGKAVYDSQLSYEDRIGADQHVFTGKDEYVWNNVCGDTVTLRTPEGGLIDQASYSRGIRDGAILTRRGNALA